MLGPNKNLIFFSWMFFRQTMYNGDLRVPHELLHQGSIELKTLSCGIAPRNDWHLFSVIFFPVDCLDPTCSSHGVCVNGECLCSPGWGGLNCELARVQCPDQCSGHGTYLPDTGLCSCDPNWIGPDCSIGKPRGVLVPFPSARALGSSLLPQGLGTHT